jgi:hypothetical protein
VESKNDNDQFVQSTQEMFFPSSGIRLKWYWFAFPGN